MSPEEAAIKAREVHQMAAAIFMTLEAMQDGEADAVLMMRALGTVVGAIAKVSDNPEVAMQTFNQFAMVTQTGKLPG